MAETGFLVPEYYVGNTSQDPAQILAIANAVALDVIERDWQAMRKTAAFLLTSSTTYPLPSDYKDFIAGTMYQHGRWDRVDIATTPDTWALLQSVAGIASLPVRARIIGNQLNVLNPQIGATINVEYNSNAPITSASGSPLQLFQADTDLWGLDDRMFQLEAIWRFKRAKGLDWQTAQLEAEARRNIVKGRDEGNSTIVPNLTIITGQPYANLWVN